MTDTLAEWIPKLIAAGPPGKVGRDLYEWGAPVDRHRLQRRLKRLSAVVEAKPPPNASASAKKQYAGRRSLLIGKLYEQLLRDLFNSNGVLEVIGVNLSTTTSEIDLLIQLGPCAAFFPLLQNRGTHILGEAKCHKKAPSSELVNETAGMMVTHQTCMAFLFVFCTKRKLAPSVRTSIAIHAANGKHIVPLGRQQLEEIVGGACVLEVLTTQHVLSTTHTNEVRV